MSEFPQYRKYPNDKAFFKIDSETTFEELTILGKNYNLMRFTAGNFLDRHLIGDMLAAETENWLIISEKEYEEKISFCRSNLKKMSGSL